MSGCPTSAVGTRLLCCRRYRRGRAPTVARRSGSSLRRPRCRRDRCRQRSRRPPGSSCHHECGHRPRHRRGESRRPGQRHRPSGCRPPSGCRQLADRRSRCRTRAASPPAELSSEHAKSCALTPTSTSNAVQRSILPIPIQTSFSCKHRCTPATPSSNGPDAPRIGTTDGTWRPNRPPRKWCGARRAASSGAGPLQTAVDLCVAGHPLPSSSFATSRRDGARRTERPVGGDRNRRQRDRRSPCRTPTAWSG